jgi:hypothetical protein
MIYSITANVRPFKMTFGTDGTELAIALVNGAATAAIPVVMTLPDAANTGFCLDYQER